MIQNLMHVDTAGQAAEFGRQGFAYLAGGTEINRLGTSFTGDSVVSIRRLAELREITEESGTVRIGAAVTFAEALEHELTPAYLKTALRFMASATKRNMATIGGNIALLRDDSYLLPTLLAAGASLELTDGRGTIEETLYAYTARKERSELITAVLVPAEAAVLSKRYANTAESHAALTVSVSGGAGRIQHIAAAVKNAGLYEFPELAAELSAGGMTEAQLAERIDVLKIPFGDDIYGSAAYKRYLLGVTISILTEELSGNGAKEG